MDSLLYSYDAAIKLALYSKFASILGIDTQSSSETDNINLGVFQIPKDAALRVAAEKRGATFLEFISYWRDGAKFSWARNRTPVARRGFQLTINGDGDSIHVKAVPVDLSYNAWFWSKDLDKIYQVIEKYVFWQQNNPSITLTYNDAFELSPDLHFGEIVDESTIGEQFAKGITYVYRMPIQLDAWIFDSDTTSKVIHKIKLTLRDQDEITNFPEIYVEDSDQDTEMEIALRFSREAIYNIHEIDLSANSIGILGSFAIDFVEDEKIKIVDSTDNDDVYTIVGVSYSSGTTTVIVAEALVSATADGTVNLKTV